MNLIYDLGFYNGDDTAFYLSKGYKVLAVEADLELCRIGQERFLKEIHEGSLILLNKAIARIIEIADFYISVHEGWSSLNKNLAESGDSRATKVKVETVDLYGLYKQFGNPYYLKVDIEGEEAGVAKELCMFHLLPRFVSFECPKGDYMAIFTYLYVAGYRGFQLRNQINNPPHTSGEFGEFLPDKWIPCDECIEQYIKYKDLKQLNREQLGLGWLDLHARL